MHVRLLVDDFGEAYRFYTQTLGLACAYGDETGPYARFDTEPGALSIFERAGQAEEVELRPAGDGCVIPLHVDDVDASARELGASEPASRPDWGLRVAYLCDPSGNLLELYSRIEMSE